MDNKSIQNRIFKGTITIVFVGILAKFASFIAEAVMAAYLGTTSQSDAYYMIASVHAVVYPMMSVGIWKVFLPLYKRHIATGDTKTANALTDKTLSFFFVVSIVVVFLLIAFSPAVVSVVAPGFREETRALCIKLVRLSAPQYIFILASAVYASMLQCQNKFLGSQIREVVSHIPTIVAAVFFYRSFGIEAMAIALVVAGVLRLLIELPFVDWGYRYKPDFDFRGNEFALMLKRLPSALVSAGVAQINTLIDKAMASTLPTGTVSALNYGHKLTNVFSGLLSSAIATAMYPQMIEMISLNKKDELSRLVTKIISLFCVLMVPITVACGLFRTELVSAVFQRGAFDASSTILTANVFALYCLSLFSVACNTVISNIFYGYGNTRTPMYIGLANLGINVALNLIFIRIWGVNGLALATSLSSFITFFIRLGASERYISLDRKVLVTVSVKVLLASAAACFTPRVIFWLHPANRYLTLVVSAAVGVGLYVGALKLLKVAEINDLVILLNQRMKSRQDSSE